MSQQDYPIPQSLCDGRFQIDRFIGRSLGRLIYEGRDTLAESANPHVGEMVIMLKDEKHPQSDEFWAKILLDIQSWQPLEHPNILGSGTRVLADANTQFIVCERAPERTLADFIRTKVRPCGGLSIEEALPLISDVANGLLHLVGQGIIHTTLSPSRCVITADNRVKIAETPNRPIVSGNYSVVMPYASLEMLNGDDSYIPDEAVCTFALACIAYEILSGDHPYRRIPTDQAQKENLQIAKIRNLSRSQNNALKQALTLQTSVRTPRIELFMRNLNGETGKSTNALSFLARTIRRYLKPHKPVE